MTSKSENNKAPDHDSRKGWMPGHVVPQWQSDILHRLKCTELGRERLVRPTAQSGLADPKTQLVESIISLFQFATSLTAAPSKSTLASCPR